MFFKHMALASCSGGTFCIWKVIPYLHDCNARCHSFLFFSLWSYGLLELFHMTFEFVVLNIVKHSFIFTLRYATSPTIRLLSCAKTRPFSAAGKTGKTSQKWVWMCKLAESVQTLKLPQKCALVQNLSLEHQVLDYCICHYTEVLHLKLTVGLLLLIITYVYKILNIFF